MPNPPQVSILMPAYNAGKYLASAVESMLQQTFRDFELIIVDDGTTDGSFDSLKNTTDNRITIIRNIKNKGLINSRNIAIEHAKSPLLACLDADDLAMPTRLERQVEAFRDDSDLAVVGSRAYLIDETDNIFDVIDVPTTHEEIQRNILRCNSIIHSSVMMRTDVIKGLGGYPDGYPLAEDYALWLRVIEKHKVINLPDRLTQYRVHDRQVSQKKILAMWQYTRKIQSDAWIALQKAGQSKYILPPKNLTLWSKLRGGTGSLGRDYYYWSLLYKRMDNLQNFLQLASCGLASAPLCLEIYSLFLQRLIRFLSLRSLPNKTVQNNESHHRNSAN